MAIDSTDPEITIAKKNHELLERDMERADVHDLVVLKRLLLTLSLFHSGGNAVYDRNSGNS
jgi:hypothetical protein